MNDLVPLSDIRQMAEVMGQGKLFGKTAEELLPLMLIAQAEGLHPAVAAQEYDIIQGRPAINSKSSLARFQKAGGRIQWGERSDTAATATFAHPQGGEVTITWTMERAKAAGLTGKDNWRKYPAQMLSARVIAEGVRSCFPACLSGLYTAEEVADMPPLPKPETPPMRDVTPPRNAEIDKLRAEMSELLASPDLPALGYSKITEALDSNESDPGILRALIEAGRKRIAEAVGKRGGEA